MPTGIAALVLLSVAVPLAVLRPDDWSIVLVSVVAFVALLTVDFLAAVPPSRIGVEREQPGRLTVGEQGQISWIVTNRADRSVRVEVADALWPSFEASRRGASFVLAPGRRHRFGARIRPSRRGRFPLSAVTVRTTGPMRLVHRQQTRDVPGSLAVLPAYPSRDQLASRLKVPLDSGIRSVRTKGTGTDFDQLREYRPGDDIRRVDWAATARQQKPIVREYRAERNQHVVVMLDNGRIMTGTVGDVPRVEHAMDAALGLTEVATGFGDNVGLVTFDSQVRAIVPASNRRSQFGRIAEAMYLLETRYDESAYRPAFTTAASRFRRRSLFVVFTELIESVAVDTLLPALTALTRTHLVMVAAVRDPDVADWSAGVRPETAGDAYRSAAAVASLLGRERAEARLRAAGVIVVDARPGELAVRVVDQYLELKARGRL